MSKDSLEKIHEVEEAISEEVKADLESVKHEFSSRLHSEITNLKAKLTVLEKKHDTGTTSLNIAPLAAGKIAEADDTEIKSYLDEYYDTLIERLS